jgi:ferredoxin
MDMDRQIIDFSRCVACYNCFKVCPTSGVEYQWGLKKPVPKIIADGSKREFMMQTAAFLFTSGSSVFAIRQPVEIYKDSTVPVIRKAPVCPPGSLSLDNFNNKCTACHLCVAACPTQVLQPTFLEYGPLGIMQPRMDYKTSFCNYDCVICSSVCPSGAIIEQDLGTKKLIQMGKAKFIQKNCVVYSQKTDCGACAEHCPTKAVRMVLDPEINKRAPKIDDSICVGCGACEYACPTKPYKSIYVESSPVHGVAKKPKEDKIKEEVNLKEDFPF